jgi:hypothetical protein
MNNMNEKEIVIEPVIPEKEWPETQLWCLFQERADKKITIHGNPDGILRVVRYCNFCIENEVPQFRTG